MKKSNTQAYATAIQGAFAPKKKKRKRKFTKKHPGFNTVADQIAQKQGVSKDQAAAMLAASSRGASPAAKKANPFIKRVGGA